MTIGIKGIGGIGGIGEQGANVNLQDVLSINIDEIEYHLTQSIEGEEFYISINY